MKFGPVEVAAAAGAILAHSVPLEGGSLKKGTVLVAADLARLAAAGVTRVTVARLERGDVTEDEAAARIATAVCGGELRIADAFTGRANLFATKPGLAVVDAATVSWLNGIDEGLTIATLAPFARVTAGQMVATVKIITFSLPETVVAAAERIAGAAPQSALSVAPFRALRIALILTDVTGSKASIIAKRQRSTAERVASLGGALVSEETVAHDSAAVASALARAGTLAPDCILVFGASAIVDRGDVIPAGVVAAGGTVEHLGMPVDPGNLLMLGRLGAVPVVGVPSCASSPKLNGFDWVIERIAAGLPVGRAEIVAMAVGGLLMEIPSRPQPRQG